MHIFVKTESVKPLFRRELEDQTLLLSRQFRALCITGPRQSGKTTLCQVVFPSKPYVSLEDPREQASAEADPSAFLSRFKGGAILDEVQRVPDLFRYLQGVLDSKKDRGQFVFTGSSNFLLQEQIAQSLAGRVGFIELLPLSYAELRQSGVPSTSVEKFILTGGYPEIWQQNIQAEKWLSAYLRTYVQRDVRLIRNISDLGTFTRFVQLIATWAGQLINRESIAKAIGVDGKTILSWLSLLESSYIIYQLTPYFENLNKRIIKAPKLYFYDTGLLCHLLNITTEASLRKSRHYGAVFENWVMTEIHKNRLNAGIHGGMHFFRDSSGNEVDLLIEKDNHTLAVEVKSAAKFSGDMLSGIRYWQKYNRHTQGILLYGGRNFQVDEFTNALNWQEVKSI